MAILPAVSLLFSATCAVRCRPALAGQFVRLDVPLGSLPRVRGQGVEPDADDLVTRVRRHLLDQLTGRLGSVSPVDARDETAGHTEVTLGGAHPLDEAVDDGRVGFTPSTRWSIGEKNISR